MKGAEAPLSSVFGLKSLNNKKVACLCFFIQLSCNSFRLLLTAAQMHQRAAHIKLKLIPDFKHCIKTIEHNHKNYFLRLLYTNTDRSRVSFPYARTSWGKPFFFSFWPLLLTLFA